MFKYLKSLLAGLSFGFVSLLSLAVQAEPFSTTVNLRYHDSGRGQDGHNSLEFRIPLTQSPSNFFYFAPHLKVFNNGRFGSNLTFGYRSLDPSAKKILGGWLSYDNRDNGFNFFQQLAGGLEFLTETFDISLNAALPIGNKRTFIGDSFPGTGTFDGTTLLIDRDRRFDEALTTVELQGGLIIPSGGDGYFRPFLGAYYLGSSQGGAVGGKAGLAYWGSIINASLGVQTDRIFGTSLLVSIGINFSPSSTPKYGQPPRLEDRMNEAIARNSTITVENQFIRDTAPAINPETGQLYRYFVVTDNPAGLKGSPVVLPANNAGLTNALAQAGLDTNGVVYVYTANAPANFSTPATVPNGTKLVSSAAPQIPFNALFGVGGAPVPNLSIPFNVGTKPVTTETITLAGGSNQGVVGFTINKDVATGANPAILGNNNANAKIAHNHITITAPTSTPIGNSGRGIVLINASGDTLIDSNNVNNAIAEGIRLDNVSGNASIVNNIVNNTRQPDVQTQVEAQILVRNNTGNVNLLIANNRVGNTGANAGVNEIDGIEVSLCRVYPDFAGCGAIAPNATVTVTGNTIENLTGTLDGADGIDFNLLGNSISTVFITNNTIDNIVNKGISYGVGDSATTTVTIANNQISNLRGAGIQIRSGEPAGSTSVVRAAVLNNNLVNTETGNEDDAAVIMRTQNTATLCLRFEGNTLNNPTSTLDYLFRRQAPGSTLEVQGLTVPLAVANPSPALEAFLNSLGNTGGPTAKYRVQNNTVQVPTAACTFP